MPRFSAAPPSGPQPDPRQPGYDPIKLLALDISDADVFRGQHRDGEWAEAVERTLRAQLERDLGVMVPGAKVASMECHSHSCELVLETGSQEARAAAVSALQYPPAADVISFGPTEVVDGKMRSTIYYHFSEHRDPEAHATWYQGLRRSWLSDAKPGVGRLAGIARVPRE